MRTRSINKIHTRLIVMVFVYVLLKFFGGSFGRMALYPVTLLVTFLHEFGHALGAVITGGEVKSLQVNWDGSGATLSRGGSPGIILMSGYLGSVLLGNLLLHIAIRYRRLTQTSLMVLAGFMLFAAIVWFQSVTSSVILVLFAALLFFIAQRTTWEQDVLLFLGIAAVLYILEDFRQGPGSDLAMYEQYVGIFPARVWQYVWLCLAILITYFNFRKSLKRTM